jgi:16S rRNA (uracil1498-N3)-methyltransferase
MTAATLRIPRFHVPASLASGATLALPQDSAHHASRVLRLEEGEPVVLFNGAGGEYAARIVRLSRDGVSVEIGAFSPLEKESPLQVSLAQGISAGDRMDLTIQKAVELGATGIQPILAERSVVRLKGERADSRHEHWQRVASAACEQCGRNRVPAVATAVSVEHFIAPANALRLLLSPGGQSTLRSLAITIEKPVVVAAGPEAGFSPREEAKLVQSGFIPVRLGPRVLRTETAGPAALAALNALYGDG